MFAWFCLLCLPMAIASSAEEVTAMDVAEDCGRYELQDYHLESQGIYTGQRDLDKMLMFEVSEKSVLTAVKLPESNEPVFIRETLTVRDSCTVMEKTLTPNITDMLKEKGNVCFVAPPQGYHDIYEFLGDKMFMAVWTFTVPAKQCFVLRFLLRTWSGSKTSYSDKLTILDGGLVLPVVMRSGLFQYERPMESNTTTVSVVYMYTSLTRSMYWRMAPSLKTSDCKC